MDVADVHAQGRVVSVLEGGYDLTALADSAQVHVEELLRHALKRGRNLSYIRRFGKTVYAHPGPQNCCPNPIGRPGDRSRRLRTMTMDKSLRIRRGLLRSRSVLSRAERLAQLKEADRWKEGDSPLGLPKVRVYKLSMKKKKKKRKKKAKKGPKGPPRSAAGKGDGKK